MKTFRLEILLPPPNWPMYSRRVHPSFRGMRRALIVEDDPVQQDAVSRLLSSGDVEMVGASTAAECLKRLREET